MPLDIDSFLGIIGGVNDIFLVIILLIFIFVAYKVFKHVVKAIIIGAIAASFPFFAQYIGLEIELSMHNILWFGLFGIIIYFVYLGLSIIYKVVKAILSPFGGSSKKVVIKERIKEVPAKENKK